MQKINHQIKTFAGRLVVGLILVGFISSCACFKNAHENDGYQVIFDSYGQFQGFSSVAAIHSEKELQKIYTQLNLTRMPAIPAPTIDFDNETFVVLPYEIKGSEKNNAEISAVTHEAEKIIISVREGVDKDEPVNQYYKNKYFFLKVKGVYNKVVVLNQ